MGVLEHIIRTLQVIFLFVIFILFNKWGATKCKFKGITAIILELGILIAFIATTIVFILVGNLLIDKFC